MTEDTSKEAGETRGWRPWLIVLLAFLEMPRAVDEAVIAHIAPMLTRFPGHGWFELLTGIGEIIGFLIAGLLVDRFAVARVACFSLLVWAALSALSAAFAWNVLLLFVEHDAQIVAGIAFGLAVVVAAKLWFPLARRARVLALLNVAATISLIALPQALRAVRWPPNSFAMPAWAAGGVAVAVVAALLAGLLWRTLRPAEIAIPTYASPSIGTMIGETFALMRRPGIAAIMLVLASHMLALSVLLRVLYLYVEFERRLPQVDFLPSVGPPFAAYIVAQIALAFWSDARARETRIPSFARSPFIVAGAALAATVGLIPLVPNAGLVPLYWLVALGMAAFPLCFTLALDVIPASLAGRFLGIAMALAMVVAMAVFMLAAALIKTWPHTLAWYFYFASSASIVGAVIAHRKLRHIDPIEDGAGTTRRLGDVFA